ncbi:hypothetical protein C0Q70_16811 [Pomacea canaliculata]|uniref:EGF-like domain-containing protein n=1 Tax=Pomacea canaliculata TaxID=400727 RepID=A0A2T7NQT9_POMCA|nr:multiple epidermal growth factor-like domains protein 6 [Pomacea canaliculata]PVD23539.1 hypothetical protein C0Q70_16811 [Pomacea canaliculata]
MLLFLFFPFSVLGQLKDPTNRAEYVLFLQKEYDAAERWNYPYIAASKVEKGIHENIPNILRDKNIGTCRTPGQTDCIAAGQYFLTNGSIYMWVSHYTFDYPSNVDARTAFKATNVYLLNTQTNNRTDCNATYVEYYHNTVSFTCYNVDERRDKVSLCIEYPAFTSVCEMEVYACPYGATGRYCNEKCECARWNLDAKDYKRYNEKNALPLLKNPEWETMNCDKFGRCKYFCTDAASNKKYLSDYQDFNSLVTWYKTYQGPRPGGPFRTCKGKGFLTTPRDEVLAAKFQIIEPDRYVIMDYNFYSPDAYLMTHKFLSPMVSLINVQYVTSDFDYFGVKDVSKYALETSYSLTYKVGLEDNKFIQLEFKFSKARVIGQIFAKFLNATLYGFLDIYLDGKLCIAWTGFAFRNETEVVFREELCKKRVQNLTVIVISGYNTYLTNLYALECKDGYFGNDCQKKCNCNGTNEICDKETGECESGCAKGFSGLDCLSRCPAVCLDDLCDWQSGQCTTGCKNNMKPPFCNSTVCAQGTYGDFCLNCGQCLNATSQQTCNETTGECEKGCKEGFEGTTCTKMCDDYCSDTCKNCLGGVHNCDLPHGVCSQGCVNGLWLPPECRKKNSILCPEGTYGVNCTRECGRCLERPGSPTAGCDAENGSCANANACEAGWTGVRCHKACSPGTYGSACLGVCGTCSNGSTCSSVSGHCPAGCPKLRSGTACQTPCPTCASQSCTGCQGSFSQCLLPAGTCLAGCAAGWLGAECRYKCPAGTHGANCTRDCGHCLHNGTHEQTTCDADTGNVHKHMCVRTAGLAKSATSSALQEHLEPGARAMWELCKGGQMCSAADGTCAQGCAARYTGRTAERGAHHARAPLAFTAKDRTASVCCRKERVRRLPAGWFGGECRLPCPPGTYGVNCSRECGRCLETPGSPTAGCDAENGSCANANACEAGWTGVRCHKACSPGTYGSACLGVCGTCSNGSTCSSVSGHCPAGCPKLRSGTACQTPCPTCASQSCTGCQGSFSQCLLPAGTCLAGCAAGWLGAECRYKCPAGTHGANCTRDCGHCLHNGTHEQTTCDADTGECPQAHVCQDGWTGKKCDKQCAAGTFGARCAGLCGSCAKGGQMCSAADGTCAQGCAARYTGKDCRTGCASCTGASCIHCKGSHGQCLLPQGTCQEGCLPGWFGGECRLPCPPGTYGVNCSRECGRCLETPGSPTAGCDAENGSCANANACEAGWTGVRCHKACSPGTYGSACLGVCGTCSNGSTCSSVSGHCPAGCPKLRSGTACQTPCPTCASQSCTGCQGSFSQCLLPAGTCLAGCAAGWLGAECRYKCPAGTHGANCTRDCGHCLHNGTHEQTTCDADTGECPQAHVCQDGWTGKKCDKQCAAGTFGSRCNLTCGYCLGGNGSCNNFDGSCTYGCISGYAGLKCLNENKFKITDSCAKCIGSVRNCLLPSGTCIDGCENHWYGDDCRQTNVTCMFCKGGLSRCDRLNLKCMDGCLPGWMNDICSVPCSEGTFGPNCNETCSPNCYYAFKCRRTNGNCKYGCAAGFQGLHCNSTCDPGFYGSECINRCGFCGNRSICHHVSGFCPTGVGCLAGYLGAKCKTLCPVGTFGDNCSVACGSCDGQCNWEDGACQFGCLPGWKGKQCNNSCDAGSFGRDCSEKCGYCNNMSLCDPLDGFCPKVYPRFCATLLQRAM